MGVFERLLVALRERIPRKVEQEDLMYSSRNKQGGKSKDKVDVFRGCKLSLSPLLEFVQRKVEKLI